MMLEEQNAGCFDVRRSFVGGQIGDVVFRVILRRWARFIKDHLAPRR